MVQMFDKHYVSKIYNLRTLEKDFSLPKYKTDYCRQSFAFTGAKLWNSLPTYVKEAQSLESFKIMLRKHLLQHK